MGKANWAWAHRKQAGPVKERRGEGKKGRKGTADWAEELG